MGISANFITGMMGFVGLLGSILFVFDNVWMVLLGGLLWQLWYILDCVDEEVARLSNKTSLLGKYIDNLSHIFVNPTIALAFGLHVLLNKSNPINAVFALLLYTCYFWKNSIREAGKKNVTAGTPFKKNQYKKKSLVGGARFIITNCFAVEVKMSIFTVVVLADYCTRYELTTAFLRVYTILFLCYLAVVILRELLEQRKAYRKETV
jgi:phosphatidylglycerophosphate synthase